VELLLDFCPLMNELLLLLFPEAVEEQVLSLLGEELQLMVGDLGLEGLVDLDIIDFVEDGEGTHLLLEGFD
jgi:hypothetical protein